MQKHRYIQYLALFILLINISLFAQSENWYELYKNNQFSKIETLLKNNKIDNADWVAFFKLTFDEDGENAVGNYMKLYGKVTDQRLKKLIIDRISQYYYAKGYYDTAERIYQDENFREYLLETKSSQTFFGVQLGAFSTYKNAVKSKNRFAGKISNISIITKNNNGHKLYVVIAGKYESRRDAQELYSTIKEQFDHKGIIVTYQGD